MWEEPYLAFSAQQRGCYWGVVGASTLLALGLLIVFTSAADSVLSTSTPAASWNVISACPGSQPAIGALHKLREVHNLLSLLPAPVISSNCLMAPLSAVTKRRNLTALPLHFTGEADPGTANRLLSGKAGWAAS